MKILETAPKRREYDDMWMLMGKIPDYDNTYRYLDEDNRMTSYTPNVWIILDVKSDKDQLRIKRGTT